MGRLNVMDTSPLFHSQLGFIYRQFRYRIPAFTPSNSPPASSRTVLLTGFTSGLGFQASLHLLRAGTNLILVARNPERCEFGLKKIRDAIGKEVDIDAVVDETTGRRRVYTMCCDQTELADVVRFGKELKMKLENGEIGGGLDAAVLNAGVSLTGWDVTKDGWERALQVRYRTLRIIIITTPKSI